MAFDDRDPEEQRLLLSASLLISGLLDKGFVEGPMTVNRPKVRARLKRLGGLASKADSVQGAYELMNHVAEVPVTDEALAILTLLEREWDQQAVGLSV